MSVQSPSDHPVGGGSNGRSPRDGGEIKTQINLPWKKAIEIAMNSLKIRIWRSLITAAGIMLSIAFLAYSGTPILVKLLTHTYSSADADSNRQVWLVTMALLVSLVGIMNAMLMSVAERFREIGTMKCLGALNSLIVRLFIIESVFMGILASVAGWLLGFLVMLLVRGSHDLSGIIILTSFVACVFVGAFLTLLAALLPAMRAAQMPPAAALRTEV